ncbi:DNA-3-methyladenine glycosylase [Brevundimonas sp. NIBR11]|uniref:DNA-3-methyladenine glycosylase n=1 Tax=Brevundimonas sp. NIBR11 TaxID=3015999 RepID=UPI0022F072B6|nr:DNA-3-methyladenine glycosylase [Brevundimonas sp. NIBR11]
MKSLSDVLAKPAPQAARDLIGATLLVDGVGGIIVETEAYDRLDPASHSFRGPTPRNAPMFGPIGRAYVYRIYGLHWCLNIVCNSKAAGSAVLIRALQPLQGLEMMLERRGSRPTNQLCAGPGRLCQALGVTSALNGLPIDEPPFSLTSGAREPVVSGPRIGIRHGAATPWRFGRPSSPYLSRAFVSPAQS